MFRRNCVALGEELHAIAVKAKKKKETLMTVATKRCHSNTVSTRLPPFFEKLARVVIIRKLAYELAKLA